jgi:hypothetical protein
VLALHVSYLGSYGIELTRADFSLVRFGVIRYAIYDGVATPGVREYTTFGFGCSRHKGLTPLTFFAVGVLDRDTDCDRVSVDRENASTSSLGSSVKIFRCALDVLTD